MWEYNHTDELYHYGVKGMKWGVRKSEQKTSELYSKKAAYKQAKKEYSKSFNKAYNRSAAAYSPFKKHRQANDERWRDAADKAKKVAEAKDAYKSAKKDFKKNATIGQKIERGAKSAGEALVAVGKLTLADLAVTGGAGSRAVVRGAKYMKDAALNKMFNTAVLDATGKVIYRYNS